MIALIKLLVILGILFLLALPYLPIRMPLTLFFYQFPPKKRPLNLIYVGLSLLLAILAILFLPALIRFANWFLGLRLVAAFVSWLPAYASYTVTLLCAIVIDLLFGLATLLVFAAVSGTADLFSILRNKGKLRAGNRAQKRAERKEKRKSKRKNRRKAGEDPEDPQKPQGPEQDTEALPAHLLPEAEPEDPGSRVFFGGKEPDERAAKASSRKKRAVSSQTEEPVPTEKGLRHLFYSLFYEKTEDGWVVRPRCFQVAKLLRNFLILTGCLYLLSFGLLMAPVFFLPGRLPDSIYRLLTAIGADAYWYPVFAMSFLTSVFWFMNGEMRRVEPKEIVAEYEKKKKGYYVDLDELEKAIVRTLGSSHEMRRFYSDDVDVQDHLPTDTDWEKDDLLRGIARYVSEQKLTLNRKYLSGFRALQDGENVLFDAPLYTSIGPYLYLYLNARIASGEGIVVVCQRRKETAQVMRSLEEGFRQALRTHKPIWTIADRASLRSDRHADVAVLTPTDFTDDKLYQDGSSFFQRVQLVLLPDADRVIRANNYHCLVMAEGLLRAVGRPVQYIFLSTRNTLGLGNSLYQYFNLDKPISESAGYYSFGNIRLYLWKAHNDGSVVIDNGAQHMLPEVLISNVAAKAGIPDINVVSEGAIYSSQVSSRWLDVYDSQERPLGFMVVADDGFNLPNVIYAYSRYIGKAVSILHVISRPYLLRDYFMDQAPRYLYEFPPLQQTMAEHAESYKSEMLLLLCKLQRGIETDQFAMAMQRLTGEEVEYGKFSGRLTLSCVRRLVDRCVSDALGKKVESVRFAFSEEDQGGFRSVQKITVRDDAAMAALLSSTQLVQLRFIGNREDVSLDLFAKLLGQRYLKGQNLVYEHRNYLIIDIDYEKGIVSVDDANPVHGIPQDYLQLRRYTLPEQSEIVKACSDYAASGEIPELEEARFYPLVFQAEDIQVQRLLQVRFSGPAIESETFGYLMLDHDSKALDLVHGHMLRRNLDEPTRTKLRRRANHSLYLALDGKFVRSDELTMTFAVLLQEMMKTLFPNQYFCIAVCPILSDPERIYESSNGVNRRIAEIYPRLFGWGATRENSIELLIVDDCEGGSGVLDILCDPEGIYLRNVLQMLVDYLDWQSRHLESPYYYFGADSEPDLFTIDQLREVLGVFARNYLSQHELMKGADSRLRCAFCQRTMEPQEAELWNRAVSICPDCAEEYRPDEAECALILGSIVRWLQEAYGETLKQPISVSQAEKPGPGEEVSVLKIERREIVLAKDLPLTEVHRQLLRQVVRVWQLDRLRMNGSLDYEGHVAHTLQDYLVHLAQYQEQKRRYRSYLVGEDEVSEGFRLLVQGMQSSGMSSAFAYMLEQYGQQKAPPPPKKKFAPGRSTRTLPDQPTRYYFASRLNGGKKEAYDRLLSGLMNMEKTIDISVGEFRVEEAGTFIRQLRRDHPEIFWWDEDGVYYSRPNGEIQTYEPVYTMTQETRARRQEEIDRAASEFLSPITESMGDWEVALKLFEGLAANLDYDSLALEREDRLGGPQRGVPDDIRNLYGALVVHKSVCAGYAKAYQYLLQKLGIEAVYAAGKVHSGGRHAWVILLLEGDYYHVDVTWGDHSNTDPRKSLSGISYEYFCITDKQIRADRSIDMEEIMPRCTAVSCNYYVRSGLYFEQYDYESLKELCVAKLKDPSVKRLELCFSSLPLVKMAHRQIMEGGGLADWLALAGRQDPQRWHSRVSERFCVLKIVAGEDL